MRPTLLLVPLLSCAAPAAAQPAPQQLPPELSDPATVDKLAKAMQSLSDAFLDLPVGEMQAALEGREATPADKQRTVGTESKMSEAELRRQIEQAKPMLQQGMKQLAAALPAMMKSMDDMQRAMDRAAASMPDPTYPKR